MSIIATAFLLALVLTGLSAVYARRRGLLAIPDDRSSHVSAVPSGGGMGIVMTWLLVTPFLGSASDAGMWAQAILPGAIALAAIGFVDDHRPLKARWRFAVQLVVSFYLLGFAWHEGFLNSLSMGALGALWLIWIANLYNFMDGSHGMAGAQGVFSGAVLAWLFHQSGDPYMVLVSALLAASCLGFLPWNLVRSRVFMGDVGSVPLGFALAGLCAYGVAAGAFPLATAVLVLAVFLVDATLTLLRRVFRGERWYTPHRQHLYQRLIQSGRSHESVLALYLSINITLVVPAMVVSVRNPEYAWFVTLGLIAIMSIGWTLAIRRLGVTA